MPINTFNAMHIPYEFKHSIYKKEEKQFNVSVKLKVNNVILQILAVRVNVGAHEANM